VTESIYDRPEVYDQIYHEKPYAEEVDTLVEHLEHHGVTPGDRLLEAACGTGTYLEYLQADFRVTGFDLNEAMLERARRKLHSADVFVADMQTFRPTETYDAVLCLFSSIGYADGLGGLQRTVDSFRKALEPGGVVVIDPWVMTDQFMDGLASMQTYESADRKIARQVVAERDGRLSSMEFHWLVADQGAGVEHFVDVHELYLFSREEYEDALETAGFEVDFDPDGLIGRGLFTGVAQ